MIVIFGIMVRVVVAVVTARRVIVVFLIPGVAVRKAVAVFVQVFVKMIVLKGSMPVPVHMQVPVQMTMFMFVLHCKDGNAASLPVSVG